MKEPLKVFHISWLAESTLQTVWYLHRKTNLAERWPRAGWSTQHCWMLSDRSLGGQCTQLPRGLLCCCIASFCKLILNISYLEHVRSLQHEILRWMWLCGARFISPLSRHHLLRNTALISLATGSAEGQWFSAESPESCLTPGHCLGGSPHLKMGVEGWWERRCPCLQRQDL